MAKPLNVLHLHLMPLLGILFGVFEDLLLKIILELML